MVWDFYLTVKVGGIAVFIFAGGIAASKALVLSRSKTFFINGTAVFVGYLCSTGWYIIQHVFGSDPYDFVDIFHAWDDAGAVLYGWILGGTLTLIVLTRLFKISTVRYLDVVLPWLLVAQFLNRLGCFDAGCCYGGLTHFPINVYNDTLDGQVHPVQLYESFYDLGLFFWLRSLKPPRVGRITFLYFIFYPAARFIFEMMRGDNQPALLFMTVPQVTSVCILATVFLLKNRILEPIKRR